MNSAVKIKERFTILEELTDATLKGLSRALIVSGPPGLGKSFTVEKALNEYDPTGCTWTIIKGYVRTTGLIRLLHQHRHENHVVVFDDADTIFWDENSLNLLKAVCDTCESRKVSYLAETNMVDDDGDPVPDTFEFNGGIIFLTNLDFDKMIEKNSKMAPHFSALISRSHYIDLSLKTKNDFLIRIDQVVKEGLLQNYKENERKDVMSFIHEHKDSLRELSLRMALKVANIRKINQKNWKQVAKVTCCRAS